MIFHSSSSTGTYIIPKYNILSVIVVDNVLVSRDARVLAIDHTPPQVGEMVPIERTDVDLHQIDACTSVGVRVSILAELFRHDKDHRTEMIVTMQVEGHPRSREYRASAHAGHFNHTPILTPP